MALPKEPRQKMINMMYLVLTALLALNVSAEILVAFKTVDESLDKATLVLDNDNNTLYKSLAEKLKQNETKDKAAIWAPKAEQARILSKIAYDSIEDLKVRLKTEAGYSMAKGDTAFHNWSGNLDASTRLMDRDGEGKKLLAMLTDYKQKLLAIDPEIAKEFASKLPLDLTKPKSEEGNSTGDWTTAYFHMTPAIAAVTILAKFQNDIKNSENQVVTYCHNKIGAVEVRYDKTGVIAGANASYVMPGDKLTVYAGVGAFSSEAHPTITINGQTREVDQHGKATLDITAGGSGAQTVRIGGSFKNQDGQIIPINETVNYTVGTPSGVAVSADKMNVLYIMGNTPNPITISGGSGSEKIQATMTGGELKRVQGSSWEAYPKTPGEQTINVTIDGKTTAKKFRVKYLPDPFAFVGAKKGGAMPSADFKAIGGLITRLDGAEFEAPFKVVSYKVGAIGGAISQYATAVNEGNRWNGAAEAIIKRASPGTQVFFDEIRVVGPDGRQREISPIFFSLK